MLDTGVFVWSGIDLDEFIETARRSIPLNGDANARGGIIRLGARLHFRRDPGLGSVEPHDAERLSVRAGNGGELVCISHAKRQLGGERHRVDVVERRVIHLDGERDFGSLRIV